MRAFTIILLAICLTVGLTTGLNAGVASTIIVNPGDDVQAAVDNFDVVYFNPGTYNFGNGVLQITKSTKLEGISDASGNKPIIKGMGNFHDELSPAYVEWYGSVILVIAPEHSVELINLRVETDPGNFNTDAINYIAGKYLKISDCSIYAPETFSGLWVGFSEPGMIKGDLIIEDSDFYCHSTEMIPASGLRYPNPNDANNPYWVLGPGDSKQSLIIFSDPSASPLDKIEIVNVTINGPGFINLTSIDSFGILLGGGTDENTSTSIKWCDISTDSTPITLNPFYGKLHIYNNIL